MTATKEVTKAHMELVYNVSLGKNRFGTFLLVHVALKTASILFRECASSY